MAKVNANGDMVTITSDITIETFNKVRKFAPETLKLKDEEGNEFFRIDFNPECHHEISENGIIFHSVDAASKIFLTTTNVVIGVHDDLELERKLITDRYANIIYKLAQIEVAIEAKTEEIENLSAAVQSSIEITGE